MDLGPEAERLLVECLRRQQAHKRARRPPAWKTWACESHDEVSEHGPRYSSPDWFGADSPRLQMRFHRAIKSLEAEGLIATWHRWGQRLTNVQLTPAGVRIAVKLVDGGRG